MGVFMCVCFCMCLYECMCTHVCGYLWRSKESIVSLGTSYWHMWVTSHGCWDLNSDSHNWAVGTLYCWAFNPVLFFLNIFWSIVDWIHSCSTWGDTDGLSIPHVLAGRQQNEKGVVLILSRTICAQDSVYHFFLVGKYSIIVCIYWLSFCLFKPARNALCEMFLPPIAHIFLTYKALRRKMCSLSLLFCLCLLTCKSNY